MLIPTSTAFLGTALQTNPAAAVLLTSFASSSSSLHMALSGGAAAQAIAKAATSALPVALAVYGGANGKLPTHFLTNGVLDVGRAKMRLEGLLAYGTICALLMNACLRLFSAVSAPSKDASPTTKRAFDIFTVCVIVSVLAGSYTTIVFTMISLYSKQALGRGLDSAFLEFYDATHVFRDSGFRSFLYSLVAFQGAFILTLFLKLKGERQKWMVGLACLGAAVAAWRWTTVMQLAYSIIFSV